MRFSPPPIAVDEQTELLLVDAFCGRGPAGTLAGIDPRLRVLDLQCRLRGPDHSAGKRDTVANHLRLSAFAEDVAALASRAGIPVVLLKFAALASRIPVGTRNACDVDVLVAGTERERFEVTLRAAGIAPRSDYDRAGEQHSVPHFHPSGLMLEIHDRLLGVRLPGSDRSARFEDLSRAGILVASPSCPGALVPLDEVLVAHLLVHAIAQHGLLPAEYPMLRVVGDLVDLGCTDATTWPAERRRAVHALIARDVSLEEVEATFQLAARLSQGDTAMLGEATPEGVLLRHMIAGALDADYRNGLKLRALREPLTDGSPTWAFLKTLPGALFLSRGDVDAIYGPPRGPGGYLARRVFRPFDLMRRAILYALRRPAPPSA